MAEGVAGNNGSEVNEIYNNGVLELLKCVNCDGYATPPIYACPARHVCCSKCLEPDDINDPVVHNDPQNEGKPCSKILNQSNLLNEIARCVKYPCPAGCEGVTLTSDTFLRHVLTLHPELRYMEY